MQAHTDRQNSFYRFQELLLPEGHTVAQLATTGRHVHGPGFDRLRKIRKLRGKDCLVSHHCRERDVIQLCFSYLITRE